MNLFAGLAPAVDRTSPVETGMLGLRSERRGAVVGGFRVRKLVVVAIPFDVLVQRPWDGEFWSSSLLIIL
jgi:hypothetical protein